MIQPVHGNEITLGYNIRGFKTSQVDPDLGSWSFDYYPLGELKSQTDAKAQVVNFTVDKLSRPLTRVEAEGTTTWTWGVSSAARNIGQLQSVSSPGSYSEAYAYDSYGRLSQSSTVADGTTYLFDQSYNAASGLLETLTYPLSTSSVRVKLKYTYQNGQLQRIHDFTGDVQTTKYWEAISTNARGMVIDEELGNGLRTFSKVDHIAGWLDYRQTAPGGGSSTQYLNYAWDKVGNLTQRKDENQALTENFFYDSLNRLDYTTGVSSLDLTYDAIGNITNKSDVGSYTYHATKKHAVTSAGGVSYGYDLNGNMNSRSGASITWTSYNLPLQINQTGGNYSQFSYGAGRARYKQVNVNGATTETTIYVAGLLEKVTVGAVSSFKHYVPAATGNAALVIRASTGTNTTYYPLRDHLGSTDRITNSAGSVVVALSFDAFGKRRGSAWTGSPGPSDLSNIASTTRNGFTGHEHLDNLGLVHMNGRVADPHLGRFISADPFIDGVTSSQGFNRYSYVANNPLTFSDPSGYFRYDRRSQPRDFGGSVSPEEEMALVNANAAFHNTWGNGSMGGLPAGQSMSGMDWMNLTLLGGFRGATGDFRLGSIGNDYMIVEVSGGFLEEDTFDGAGNWVHHEESGIRDVWVDGAYAGYFRQSDGQFLWDDSFSSASSVAIHRAMFDQYASFGARLLASAQGTLAEARRQSLYAGAGMLGAEVLGAAILAGRGAAAGTATIYRYGTQHASVAVRHGDTLLHTHQVVIGNGTTIARTSSAGATGSIQVALPNARAAMEFQRSVLGTPTGVYNLSTNSCVTHCGDVLRAGGLDVPSTTRAIINWLRN